MHHFAIASPFVVSNGNISAAIAQLGERQTEDLKVPGSIPGLGIFLVGLTTASWKNVDRDQDLVVRHCGENLSNDTCGI